MSNVSTRDHSDLPASGRAPGPAVPLALAPIRSVADWRDAILAKLVYALGRDQRTASDRDWFEALALALRDRVVAHGLDSDDLTRAAGHKRVYYLSLEFLVGRLLVDTLTNLDMTGLTRAALGELGADFERVRAAEPDAALGNGGLGRLAACFMESAASLAIPTCGYGIRYENGLFRQEIRNGVQVELPEDWLAAGNPWEIRRPERDCDIGFGGHVEQIGDDDGATRCVWHPAELVRAVAHDTPVIGWRARHANRLRLWSARAVTPLRLDAFNAGDYLGAVADDVRARSVSRVLYPSDTTPAGQELRLRQEYFFSAASLHDILRRHLAEGYDLSRLPDMAAIQLNDTHPAIAIAEIMRLLVDRHGAAWNEAWRITCGCFSYTNHTLLPEALETWPVALMERLLPRHMQIIYRLNADHLEAARAKGAASDSLQASLSMIEETQGRRVRMGTLAFVGSHRVNGVSALHTGLMRETVFHDLHVLHPDRITNVTNGITFRRWLFEANPRLTGLLVDVLGDAVLDDPSVLAGLRGLAGDPGLRARLIACRRANKVALSNLVGEQLGIGLDPDALFDVHVKRLHEYKRQLLNILEAVSLWQAIRARPAAGWVPRVKIFAGKAAASYAQARLIIRLINDVASVINNDPVTSDLLKVVFLPNFNVSLAEIIIPAADLSEQISTAGMEASGTGNMKFALNGALTIGTLDGANIEIRDHVGADNIFIFGLTAAEVAVRRLDGWHPECSIVASPALAGAIEAIGRGTFSPGEDTRFAPIVDELRRTDRFLVTADFDSYAEAQRRVAALWRDRDAWWRAAVLNTAGMGPFSSDRAIGEYAEKIWHVTGLER